ncbi:MAG TPA: hypothetical protein ENK67_01035 [Flavobacteriia bacterium]|nr:hypothetical protein [Flavobacteriia bacterium]
MIKKLPFLGVLFILQIQLFAQVGIGTTTPDNSAKLHIHSTDKGILIPKMTESQKNAIPSPATGLLIFQTDNQSGFYYYDGSIWKIISGGSDNDWAENSNNLYNLNTGNVGIGTNSPTNKLHIKGTLTYLLNDGFEDNSLSPFTTSGDRNWETTNNAPEVFTGTRAARTKTNLADNESSTLEYTNTLSNDGKISFALRTSTESFDKLKFYIDGVEYGVWSGETAYTTVTYNVLAGNHTFTWTYSKDFSVSSGDDRVAIDDVKIFSGDSSFRLEDGNQSDGFILMSDANGNAKWANSSSLDDGDWTITGNDMSNANSGQVSINNSIVNGGSLVVSNNDNSITSVSSYGIHGITHAVDLIGNAGVFGESVTSGDHEIGVKGNYALWGVAVAGIAWGISDSDIPATAGSSNDKTNDTGVFGGVDYASGYGVYGLNKDNTGFAGYYEGNHAITGTKSASVPTSKGNQLLYSSESPEIWFEDYGREKLKNGMVHITLDALFYETIFVDEEHPMHVFLQEQGECNGLYFIPDEDGKGFTVKEKNNGQSNIFFSYRISAKRKFYQDHRFGLDPTKPLKNNISDAKYVKPRTTEISEMKRILEEAEQKKQTKVKTKKKLGKK